MIHIQQHNFAAANTLKLKRSGKSIVEIGRMMGLPGKEPIRRLIARDEYLEKNPLQIRIKTSARPSSFAVSLRPMRATRATALPKVRKWASVVYKTLHKVTHSYNSPSNPFAPSLKTPVSKA